MQFKSPSSRVQPKPKRSTSQFKLPEQKSATTQFKSPSPRVQPKPKRSTSQFKLPEQKSATTQFKSPSLRVQSKPKRPTSQFKLPGPIIRSNIYAPAAQAISTSLIPMPSQPPIIIEQPTQPLPVKVQPPTQSAPVVTQSPYSGLSVNETIKGTATGIDNRLVWIMAIACGLSVGNLIYAQPLLAEIGRSFAASANRIGLTATLGQLGYALGLIFIVPLGEKYNQRSLIVILLGAVAIALVEMATAPTSALLIIGSGAVGLTSVIPELIIPFAAGLAPEKVRGRVVGTLLCGLFIGTPLAAVFSGIVGQYLGWRTMYWIAAGMMITLAIVLHFVLPDSRSAKKKVSYPQLLGSLWKLLRSEPVLQEISILGFLAYGAFNAFLVALSFILGTAPYHYGSEVIGLFGLVGIAGALAALLVGKFADRRDARYANGTALAIALLAIVVMWLAGQWLIGLIVGAILLDVGVQSNQVANETRIYTLQSTAWTRLYTIHIFLFCIGGAFGSALGTLGWRIANQNGVYGTACCMLLVALGFYALHSKRIRQWRKLQGR